MKPLPAVLLASLSLMVASTAAAVPVSCSATSAAHTLPLVELYTSEGCDSCPPADRWLRKTFPPHATEATGAAVLAFHVDYWNELGWTDRFARHEYTLRQQAAMRAQHARTVYSPQLLVQGRDRGLWRAANLADVLREASAQPARAGITLDVRSGPAGVVVDVRASLTAAVADPVVQVALTESGLASTVTAGENAGVRLVHDHVVRVLSGPIAFDATGHVAATRTLPVPAERGQQPTVVAFVQDRRTGAVLQALALPLCGAS